ncbi:hypothetical protein [Perlucidibaca aquatica]|uniref:hypothetical protein n=1 Tax=Perlucidibaca aquatica TaxID=1852776 RepID=UPI00083A8FE2|nr:hypothetical protein [Perlucidibaca aquatica]
MDLTALWQELYARPDFWGFVSIPIVAAVVTWAHVWWAVKMMMYPINYIGIRTPRLRKLFGINIDLLGWQGIIPRGARRMSDIVVDNAISKMGSVSDFVRQMEPEKIGNYVAQHVSSRIEEYTDEAMTERNAVFWENLPPLVRKGVYRHVRNNLPKVMQRLIHAVIDDIDNLVDVKEMCGRQLEADRALVVRLFSEVGDAEFRFIVNVSFWIGLGFGLLQMLLFYFIPWHGMLPLYAAVLGLATNWLALAMVFRPLNPVRIGPFSFQGLFLRRQAAVSDKFAELCSQEILTIHRFMSEMLIGEKSERARRLIKRHISTLVDDSPIARSGAQVIMGATGYSAFKTRIAEQGAAFALQPLANKQFNQERSAALAVLLAGKMKEMTPGEFQDLLRPAFQQDEWILLLLGAVTGLIAGTAQLLLGFA